MMFLTALQYTAAFKVSFLYLKMNNNSFNLIIQSKLKMHKHHLVKNSHALSFKYLTLKATKKILQVPVALTT